MGPVSAQNPATAQENPLMGFGQNLLASLGQNPSTFGQNPSPFGQNPSPFGQNPLAGFGQAPFGGANQNPLSMQSPSILRPASDGKPHPRHTVGKQRGERRKRSEAE